MCYKTKFPNYRAEIYIFKGGLFGGFGGFLLLFGGFVVLFFFFSQNWSDEKMTLAAFKRGF